MYDELHRSFAKTYLEAIARRKIASESDVEKCRKTYIPWGGAKISKELFCKAIRLLQEQETIDDEFGRALQKVGNGHFVYGTENKYREALLMVLKDDLNDQYDYIDWWLYEGAPDYKVWSEDESKEWDLTEPEDLYDFITTECK